MRWLRLLPTMSLARCTHVHGRVELYSTTSSSLDAALSPFCSREIYYCDIEAKLYVSRFLHCFFSRYFHYCASLQEERFSSNRERKRPREN